MAGSKKKYVVFHDGSTAKLSEKALSRRIRMGWYEGHETVRGIDEPETAVRPLHTLALYQAIHQLSPAEAAGKVQVQKAQGFAWHAAVFVAMMAFLDTPFWGVFWAMGLASHGAASLPALRAVFGDGLEKGIARLGGNEPFALETPPGPAADADPEPEPEPEPPTEASASDTLSDELSAEWARLDALRESLDEAGHAQLEAAKQALSDVLAQRAVVREHLRGEDEESLDLEADDLVGDLANAPDERTREVLEQALSALQARRDAVAELRSADLRLGARARATLHQLKSIRMSLVTSGAGTAESGRTALGVLTEDLRHEATSAAELDEALAEARSGGRHTRPARETR